MQKRERVPLSGRSIGSRANGGQSARDSGPESARSGISTGRSGNESLPAWRKDQLNNPLEVFRPYSPEVNVADSHVQRPPILPKNRFSTVPPEDPTLGVAKLRRKTVTPASFIEANLAPSWFEDMDQKKVLLDNEGKIQYCRDFVERNRDRLWKFDLAYMNRTPRDVANDLISRPGIMDRMKKFNAQERALRLSSSEQFKASFRDEHLGNSKAIITSDPFLSSMHTAREDKIFTMTNLMTNNGGEMLQYGKRNQRGYKHTTGYGNFSNFNGMLQLNKSSMLTR